MASIVPTAHGDGVTANATTFRAVFSTSEMGESLANYLRHILGGVRAVVIYRDNGFGRPIADGFKAAAQRLKLTATYRAFKTDTERDEAVRLAAADPDKPAVVLAMIDVDAVPVLTALRRQGSHGPVLGPSAIAGEKFAHLFADLPEEKRAPGFFTNGVYAASPIMLDSANAETVAFVARFRARYGREPSWVEAQAYDATRLAVAAVRSSPLQSQRASDLRAQRDKIRAYLASLDGPSHAVAGLAGPLWFTPERGRQLPVRVGRFQNGLFESAPLQLVPVPNADPAEIAARSVLDLGSGHFARRQQVVYTGIFLNEIPRVDIAQSAFTADLYLWIRFARGVGGNGADPAEFDFPDLVRGSFDGKRPSAERELDDGTTYRLWRMRGDFKNDFDLHHYPADRQTLIVRFFNARAASDRLVYVLDRRSFDTGAGESPDQMLASRAITASAVAGERTTAHDAARAETFGSAAAPSAFRNLTQWEVLRVIQRRDNLVTESALGDPGLVGLERMRELSGFNITVDLRRRVVTTLAKTLLPLGLMALIMFASLYFPTALVKEKVTVAITGALSGAVLLSAINSQLGNVGYVIAVEYGFYMFFALCLLCIMIVLVAERLRTAGRGQTAVLVEQTGRYLFVLTFVGTVAAASLAYARW